MESPPASQHSEHIDPQLAAAAQPQLCCARRSTLGCAALALANSRHVSQRLFFSWLMHLMHALKQSQVASCASQTVTSCMRNQLQAPTKWSGQNQADDAATQIYNNQTMLQFSGPVVSVPAGAETLQLQLPKTRQLKHQLRCSLNSLTCANCGSIHTSDG